MADTTLPIVPTRQALGQVFKDQKTLIAMEKLFQQASADLPAQVALALEEATAALALASSALQKAQNLADLTSAATARNNLGLGALATQNTINDDDWSGTALAIGNGGTAAGTPSGARANLGLEIGVDVQGEDATLTALSGKSITGTGDIVLSDAPTFTSGIDVGGQARADSLRLDQAASASTATIGFSTPINLNGSTYYILLSNAP